MEGLAGGSVRVASSRGTGIIRSDGFPRRKVGELRQGGMAREGKVLMVSTCLGTSSHPHMLVNQHRFPYFESVLVVSALHRRDSTLHPLSNAHALLRFDSLLPYSIHVLHHSHHPDPLCRPRHPLCAWLDPLHSPPELPRNDSPSLAPSHSPNPSCNNTLRPLLDISLQQLFLLTFNHPSSHEPRRHLHPPLLPDLFLHEPAPCSWLGKEAR
jgi:hypothetical protein